MNDNLIAYTMSKTVNLPRKDFSTMTLRGDLGAAGSEWLVCSFEYLKGPKRGFLWQYISITHSPCEVLVVCMSVAVFCKQAGKAMATPSYDPVTLAPSVTETMEHGCVHINSSRTLSPPLLCPSESFRPSHLAQSCWEYTLVPSKSIHSSVV